MANPVKFVAAAAAIGTLAAPATAQYYPPQPTYPQTYPGQTYPQQTYPPQTYPQQANPYGYGQGYGNGYGYNQGTTGNPVTDVIDQLLGNRYSVTDRQAVRSCANAARTQAAQQYGGGYGGYNNGYGGNGYNGYGGNGYNGYGANGYGNGYAANLHVTSITNVERRSDGLRVFGTLGLGGYGGQYGNQYGNQHGYQNGGGYAGPSLSFRCNVAYNGVVTSIRVGRAY
jgi:hypothetical protein